MALSKHCANFLYDRCIDPEITINLGIRTADNQDRKENFFDRDWELEDLLVFENTRGGKTVGTKFRDTYRKGFLQKKGAENLLFTGNTELLEHSENFNETLIIVEGEMDWLALHTAGFPICASAPSSSTMKPDPETGLYPAPKWMEAEYDALMSFKNIIIAVDNDETGKKLKQAMIDNLDKFSLYEVDFPEGCKDANDVLRKSGEMALRDLIELARPVPVHGVRKAWDIMRDKDPEFIDTGWEDLDQMVKLTPGLFVLTGYSGQGKSQFLRQLVASLIANKGMKGVCAFFEDNTKYVVKDIANQIRGFRYNVDFKDAVNIINDKLDIIDARQARGGGQRTSTDWLLDVMQAKNLGEGARFMVLDTWSRIARTTNARVNQTEQINQELQKIQDFAMEYGLFIIVAAHPRKPGGEGSQPPTEYDIADSRSFNDNADGVWVWHRPHKGSQVSYFRNAKVRNQQYGGKIGWMQFMFDLEARRFIDGEVLHHKPEFGTS